MSTVEKMSIITFLVRKFCQSSAEQNRVTFLGMGSAQHAACLLEVYLILHDLKFPESGGK